MKKRVLLLSTVHPPTDPRIVYKTAPSLAQKYEVFLALPNLLTAPSEDASIATIRLPLYRHLLFRLLFCHPIVLWKCLRLRPAVLHIFVPELIPIAFLFRALGATVVYEIQENLYKKFSIKHYNKAAIFQYFFRLFDHLARRYFHCIFTEDAYQIEYSALTFEPAIIHNFPSLNFLDRLPQASFANPSSAPTFFYSGVISIERAFDTLVAAFALLKQKYPEFKVLLFGPFQVSAAALHEIADFEKVKPHLTFYGYTDQRIALSYAAHCTAGLALLKPVGDYPDSYTTKLFEYMALQLPVITSDFALYQQVVVRHGCGFCISPYNAQQLADAMIELIENPVKAKEMGTNGRSAVEKHYNWRNEEHLLIRYYASLFTK
ncbi:glycosyltransferase [Arundinibacter roseus]|uniref:Glycosyltransferase n=1 Tax=Arundinibacter roseus TaxID=2070510 RepID=A0A4R4K8C6_9BACT|nr:glycosyltransferase [Arundinibacter roseus]TDB63643.1 glycosyltransferase [Arundinibacter roseus]